MSTVFTRLLAALDCKSPLIVSRIYCIFLCYVEVPSTNLLLQFTNGTKIDLLSPVSLWFFVLWGENFWNNAITKLEFLKVCIYLLRILVEVLFSSKSFRCDLSKT